MLFGNAPSFIVLSAASRRLDFPKRSIVAGGCLCAGDPLSAPVNAAHDHHQAAGPQKPRGIFHGIDHRRQQDSRRCSQEVVIFDQGSRRGGVAIVEPDECPARCVLQQILVAKVPQDLHMGIQIGAVGRRGDETASSATPSVPLPLAEGAHCIQDSMSAWF